jgi:glycosyltransferase involved in cell wall biosynthesis
VVPRAFHARALLEQFVTDFSADAAPWRWLGQAVPKGTRPAALRRLLARRAPEIPTSKVRHLSFYAISGLWGRRRGEAQTDFWARRNAKFGRLVVKGGFGAAKTVYGFNGAAVELFEAARKQGCKTILDQTAAPWRYNSMLLQREAELWHGWDDRPAEIDVSGELSLREEEEWSLADNIICGSHFAADALVESGGPKEKCVVLPYPIRPSIDISLATAHAHERRQERRKMRVLFVGTLQLRKGVQYLTEALRQLPSKFFEARFVGPNLLSDYVTRELSRDFELVGAVPRSEMSAHYQWADVFVLPTLSEGSANVCAEALAAGLPVITTPNAGSTVEHEMNGLIVPARDSSALASAIECLVNDEGLRQALGRAVSGSASFESFEDYAEALSNIVGGGLG